MNLFRPYNLIFEFFGQVSCKYTMDIGGVRVFL